MCDQREALSAAEVEIIKNETERNKKCDFLVGDVVLSVGLVPLTHKCDKAYKMLV